MSNFDLKLMNILKSRAKALGITQADLARELDVSLVTVKRWFAGKGLRITTLKALCDLLHLSVSEVVSSVETEKASVFRYTLRQEEVLAQDPKALALFDLLIGGSTLGQLKAKYKLEDKKLETLLLKLDRIGLIELHPKNKVKLKTRGEPSWNPDGPLERTYRKQMIESLLGEHEKAKTTFFIHDYLPSDLEKIQKIKKDLEEFMLSANTRAAHRPTEAKSFGVYVTIKEFEWSLRHKLEKE